MNNDGAAEDALFTVKRDDRVLHVDFRDARAIRLHVPQIPSMAMSLAVFRASVLSVVGIEVGAGRGASIGVVAKLVDMESMQAFGEPLDLALDADWAGRRVLRQIDDPLDRFAGQYADGFHRHL